MDDLDDDGALVRILTSERGIWLAAKTTIMAKGGDPLEAGIYAAQVADDLMTKGNMPGARLWQRVQDRISDCDDLGLAPTL